MSIKINNYVSPEFPNGKDETVNRFVKLILDKKNDNENFVISQLTEELELSDLEQRQYKYVLTEISNSLKDTGRVKVVTGSLIRLKPELKTTSHNLHFNDSNVILGDNVGEQLKISDSKKLKVKIVKHKKENKPIKLIDLILKFWWQILIPLAIGVVLILIERNIIDMSFVQ